MAFALVGSQQVSGLVASSVDEDAQHDEVIAHRPEGAGQILGTFYTGTRHGRYLRASGHLEVDAVECGAVALDKAEVGGPTL